ncbi:MAG: formylmethanofuran dehydrogenase subunit C [Acetobacteraceae bacterium]|nr:formylmethanofuran dehydrogenase subunit C [Acetobacteraceae bacterium]
MSALRFFLREPPPERLDLSVLRPDRLAGLSPASMERLVLSTTRATLVVADLFRIIPGDAERVVIEGGSERFDGLGAGMTRGELILEGSAGCRAGQGMRGGRLVIRGNAGAFAAAEMRGGELEITGDAGDFLGAPLPGGRLGMQGGVVVVRGSAGARAGDRQRRGLIVIEGGTGPYPASRMLAGTLIVCGEAGAMPGYLMRRGSLFAGKAALLPTFLPVRGDTSVFRRLLARALSPFSPRAAALVSGENLARFLGDQASLGKGEAFLAA